MIGVGNGNPKERAMSEWIIVEKQEDVELSDDGKTIEVLFQTNRWGNRYIEIPVEFVKSILEVSV